ncbi:hypothetical protein [Acinetobacter sp. ANC 4177]|uniref:hypothetical protein n=1 Tax=Acinetobacter sp. ANC 4177 TaxID=2529838 RepID=UPI0013F149D8|nr:hypothetical protein [Acinetobacter sp. ANC 4177]
MIDVCGVCGTLSDNCTHYDSMIVCDVCEEDFNGCSHANDMGAEFDDNEEPADD